MPANYLLRFWGRDRDAFAVRLGLPTAEEADGASCLWFYTPEQRELAIAAASAKGELVSLDRIDGPEVHKRLIVTVTLRMPGGDTFKFDHDFGYGGEENHAHYMFEEGNYSCDCNKSLFIQRKCMESFPALDCGDTIELVSLDFSYVE